MLNKLANSWRSTVIWFNSLVGGAVVALPVMQDAFPQLQGYVPDKWYHYVMGTLIVGNIILRFKTRLPLDAK